MTSTLTTRRAPSSVGRPVNVDAVVDAILTATDGATVDARGNAYGGSGIIVAMPEHGETVSTDGAWQVWGDARALVTAWVERTAHAVTATSSPARYWGAWVDHGTLYLDVVEAYSSADRDLAIAAGRARDQIAVWDAGRGEEIPTGGTGELAAAV